MFMLELNKTILAEHWQPKVANSKIKRSPFFSIFHQNKGKVYACVYYNIIVILCKLFL